MTLDEWKRQMDELKRLLTQRLMYSKNWDNVQLKTKKTFLEIKWFNPKRLEDFYDPDGNVIFKIIRIAPLNMANLTEEVKRQEQKLKTDIADAERRARLGGPTDIQEEEEAS